MTHQKNSEMKEKFPILVFDTNIFLTGIDINIIDSVIYTTLGVIEEIKASKYITQNRNILNKINAAVEQKKLIVSNPTKKFVEKVYEKSKLTGDFKALSITDKKLIALALELAENSDQEVILYTNDYSIENICSELGIPFIPLYKEGIKFQIFWEFYCPFCNEIRTYEGLNNICEVCGTQLKRKPKKV